MEGNRGWWQQEEDGFQHLYWKEKKRGRKKCSSLSVFFRAVIWMRTAEHWKKSVDFCCQGLFAEVNSYTWLYEVNTCEKIFCMSWIFHIFITLSTCGYHLLISVVKALYFTIFSMLYQYSFNWSLSHWTFAEPLFSMHITNVLHCEFSLRSNRIRQVVHMPISWTRELLQHLERK